MISMHKKTIPRCSIQQIFFRIIYFLIPIVAYNRLRLGPFYCFLLLLTLQLGSCKCAPNKKKPLTNFSELKHGGLHMKVAPAELVGVRRSLSVKFTPTNEQVVFLDRYKLTIVVEDRAGVIFWPSRIHEQHTVNDIKIKDKPLDSLFLFTQLDPKNTHEYPLTINLELDPDTGSRQIVIKFKLYDYQNKLIQEEAATWRRNYKEPIPVPEDDIDPTKVTRRKFEPTAKEKELEEEILRRQREQEEQEA